MTEAQASPPRADIRGVDVAYGGIRAVRQLNLHVNAGELVALIGADGAGKSTTLRAICGSGAAGCRQHSLPRPEFGWATRCMPWCHRVW